MTGHKVYTKSEPFITSNDVRSESGRENWSGVFGMFVLPLLLVAGIFGAYKLLTPHNNDSQLAYQNGGYINTDTQIGVGGAPPTSVPVKQSDLQVYSSNMISGMASGYISKQAYENGARVFLTGQTRYEQHCLQNGKNDKTETQSITITKGADTYSATYTNAANTDGYNWTVDFDLSAPANLCAAGYMPDKLSQTFVSGRVFLSADQGVTTLTDQNKSALEISLTP